MSWGRPAHGADRPQRRRVGLRRARRDRCSLRDALGLVAERGRRMQALPAGSMLSVRLPAAELAPRLPAGVVIAAENAPGLCVASGPTEAIAALEAELAAGDVVTRRLVTSHAFHSAMMDPVIEPMAARIAQVRLSAPKLSILSTVTAKWLTDAEATSTRYWAEHLRLPVRFGPAATQVLAEPQRVLIGDRPARDAVDARAPGGHRQARCRRRSRAWPTPPSASPRRSRPRSASCGRSARPSTGRPTAGRAPPAPSAADVPVPAPAPLGRRPVGGRRRRRRRAAAAADRRRRRRRLAAAAAPVASPAAPSSMTTIMPTAIPTVPAPAARVRGP